LVSKFSALTLSRTLAEDLLEELHDSTRAFLRQLVAAERDPPYTNNRHYLADSEERARKALTEQLQEMTDDELSLSAEQSSGLDTLAKADAYFKVGRAG
jgi:hypothetical protein